MWYFHKISLKDKTQRMFKIKAGWIFEEGCVRYIILLRKLFLKIKVVMNDGVIGMKLDETNNYIIGKLLMNFRK